MRCLLCFPIVVVLLAVPASGEVGTGSLFEWVRMAPVVVAGTSLGEDGKYVEFRVTERLRGDLRPGQVLDIDVRHANRERDRLLTPRALRLDAGLDYLLLLDPVARDAGRPPYYRIVRGVNGTRELPAEGRRALIAALQRFVEIQDAGSEAVTWAALAQMLQETDTLLVEAALEQFLRFRRGTPELLADLGPLLDHPAVELRVRAARVVEQILERERGDTGEAEATSLRNALVARARRDPSASVRVAATHALAALPDAAVVETLREIADSDPEQNVRYAAEVLLLERRTETPPAASPRPH